MSDRIYSAEQIVVPPELPELLKNFTKEVIRHSPQDIVGFSREYEGLGETEVEMEMGMGMEMGMETGMETGMEMEMEMEMDMGPGCGDGHGELEWDWGLM